MSLIIFTDKEESKTLGWLHWPPDILVTALSLDIAPQISNSWEYVLNTVPSDIKYVFIVTPVFSSVRRFMHALLSFQCVTSNQMSVTQLIT